MDLSVYGVLNEHAAYHNIASAKRQHPFERMMKSDEKRGDGYVDKAKKHGAATDEGGEHAVCSRAEEERIKPAVE
ncbi:MAG: hypothetical protein IJD60_11420 [Clostridia bacterium]|nr:hypothetical protein [Clostridia bacterium]